MALGEMEILNGSVSLIFVVLSILIGIRIASRYRKFKVKMLLLVGITWLGMSLPWWPASISFLMASFTGGNGLQDAPIIYLTVGYLFLPIFLFSWLTAVSILATLERKKQILLLYTIFAIIFEIFILYYLFTDTTQLGVLLSPVDIDFEPIMIVFLLSSLVIFVAAGLVFASKSLKSDNKEMKLKGKFLILAIILYLIGAAMDAIKTLPPNRIILMVSAIMFYIGFILPDFVKKRFIKS